MKWWILVPALLLTAGCKPNEEAVTAAQPFDIYFTCDTNARIEPCGCFSGQYGGLTRVSTALKKAPATALKVEVGNAIGGLEDFRIVQYGYLLQACAEIGYATVNLGEREAQLPAAVIRDLVSKSPVPLLSANVLDAATREPLARPSVLVKYGAINVGFLGIVDPESVNGTLDDSVVVSRMGEALKKELAAMKSKADVLVCLAFTDEEGLEKLAREFYEFDLILGGDVRQPSSALVKVNQSHILATTNQARALGEVHAMYDPVKGELRDARGDVKLMVDSIMQDQKIREYSTQYRREIRDMILDIDRPASQDENRVPGVEPMASFVGAATCSACHPKAYAVWSKSQHWQAFESLVKKDSDADPSCIGCHVVGFGEPTGYLRKATAQEQLKGVSCESCHGPGSEHVKVRQAAKPGEEVLMKMRPVGQGQCVQCHHGEFSMPFKFDEFWKVIEHGKE